MVGMHISKDLNKNGLAKLVTRYASRSREGKIRILDELCEAYGYERKYAIKLLVLMGGRSGYTPSFGGISGPRGLHNLAAENVYRRFRKQSPRPRRLLPCPRPETERQERPESWRVAQIRCFLFCWAGVHN